MDFEDIKGVGESTAEKLREAGYTPSSIIEASSDEIIEKTGLTEKLVEKIILEAGKKDDIPEIDPEVPLDDSDSEDFLEGENRYLVAAFKKSRHYKTPLTKKGLRESFKRYKKIGVDHK